MDTKNSVTIDKRVEERPSGRDKTIKVKVISDTFGSYVKGDILSMAESTAKGCLDVGEGNKPSIEILK